MKGYLSVFTILLLSSCAAIDEAELAVHPLYLAWSEKDFVLEDHARSIVAEKHSDSKN